MFYIFHFRNLVRESILSSLDLGSHLFSSFFQAIHKSPLGKAQVLELPTIVRDISFVAKIKSLYPLLFAVIKW